MMRQLGVATVQQRIVQVRVQHAAFEIVQDDPARRSAEERERPHVALQPRHGIHMPHDGDKHVPRIRQHQDERVQNHRVAADRVGPLAQASEIDLRLLARRRIVAEHGDALATSVGLGEIRQCVAAERWQAGLQPFLVMQPLPHGARSIDLQPLDDLLAARSQFLPRCSVLARCAELRTDARHERRPTLWWRIPARTESGLASRTDVLPHGVAIQPQTLGNRSQRPSSRPMLQHLDHVRHLQAPSTHGHLT
jgi:hypothetical protein